MAGDDDIVSGVCEREDGAPAPCTSSLRHLTSFLLTQAVKWTPQCVCMCVCVCVCVVCAVRWYGNAGMGGEH
jgi:hypothetical protein